MKIQTKNNAALLFENPFDLEELCLKLNLRLLLEMPASYFLSGINILWIERIEICA